MNIFSLSNSPTAKELCQTQFLLHLLYRDCVHKQGPKLNKDSAAKVNLSSPQRVKLKQAIFRNS